MESIEANRRMNPNQLELMSLMTLMRRRKKERSEKENKGKEAWAYGKGRPWTS
jgi:hypothetical protein